MLFARYSARPVVTSTLCVSELKRLCLHFPSYSFGRSGVECFAVKFYGKCHETLDSCLLQRLVN